MTNKELGLKIKELRSKYSLKIGKKFLQKDLAEAVGISRGYIGDIESGRTKPNPELLGKIVDALDGDIWDVIDTSYNGEIIVSDDVIKKQQAKYNVTSKIIDDKKIIESWISKNNIYDVLRYIYTNNDFFRKYSSKSYELSKLETNNLNDYSYLNRVDFYEKNLIDKIIKLVENEEEIMTESIKSLRKIQIESNNKNIYYTDVVAAHNDDCDSEEQQQLMKQDIDEL